MKINSQYESDIVLMKMYAKLYDREQCCDELIPINAVS
jgi:hypothetical protein